MADERLAGCRAKVARAREHLCVLKASIESFVLDTDAYSIVEEPDQEAGQYTFRLKLNREPPLTLWALLIGDCIHNARSALDHLLWAIVLLKHPAGLADSTINFPVLRDKSTFNGRKEKLKEWVGDRAAGMIENMQPFNGAGPDDNALLFIHSRDITDKHKLLLPFFGIPEHSEWTVELVDDKAPMPDIGGTGIAAGPLKDGAIVANFSVRPAQAVVNVKFNAVLNVILEAPPPKTYLAVPSLNDLIGVVESVIGDFLPLFSHGAPPAPHLD